MHSSVSVMRERRVRASSLGQKPMASAETAAAMAMPMLVGELR